MLAHRPLADPGRTALVGRLAASLLSVDVPASTAAERRSAAAAVEDSVAAMPDWTRAGVLASAVLAAGVVGVRCRRPFDRLDERRRGRVLVALADGSVPLVTEVARATRSLALVAWQEQHPVGSS